MNLVLLIGTSSITPLTALETCVSSIDMEEGTFIYLVFNFRGTSDLCFDRKGGEVRSIPLSTGVFTNLLCIYVEL